MKKILLFMVTLVSLSIYAQDIESNLVAHYAFCGNLNDISGNSNHGAFMGNGTVIYSEDRFGQSSSALTLNGYSDYVSVASSASLNSPVEHITVSLWFNYSSDFGGWITPFTKTNSTDVMTRQYGFGINANTGKIYMSTTYVGQYDFEPNTWYHAAITYNETELKSYINGEFIASEIQQDPVVQNDLPLEIGREVPVVTEYYAGLIDEIRIYDRALSANEVSLLAETADCESSSISEKQWDGEISVFPNPAQNVLNLDFASSGPNRKIMIYNQLGRLIYQEQSTGHRVEIPFNSFSPGLYQLYVEGEEGRFTKKIIKQ